MRNPAKVGRPEPPGHESPVPEKQELYQSSQMERCMQGTRAGSQEGQWSPKVPRVTKRGSAPWGRTRHTQRAELLKGLECTPSGPTGVAQAEAQAAALSREGCAVPGAGSGGGSMWRWLCGPKSTIPVAQAPEPKAPRDTAQDTVLPLGQAEARRTQDSEDTPATRWHRTVETRAPLPPEHPGPCRLGDCSSYC